MRPQLVGVGGEGSQMRLTFHGKTVLLENNIKIDLEEVT